MKPTNVSDFNRPTISIDLEILRNNNIIMVTIFAKAYLWATENCVRSIAITDKKMYISKYLSQFRNYTEFIGPKTCGIRNRPCFKSENKYYSKKMQVTQCIRPNTRVFYKNITIIFLFTVTNII